MREGQRAMEVGDSVRIIIPDVFHGHTGTIVRIKGRYYWVELPYHLWGVGPWAFEAEELEMEDNPSVSLPSGSQEKA